MVAKLNTISTSDEAEWRRHLVGMRHDFYHLPEYHRLAECNAEGRALLFAYQDSGYRIVLPLLLREIASIEGLERAGAGLLDATSVYGYAGPLTSARSVPEAILEAFKTALQAELLKLGVISVFSRLHPILANHWLVAGLGTLVEQGRTVSIDLSGSDEEQFLRFRSNHRRNIRKLRHEGFRCEIGGSAAAIEAFIAVYHETMRRVGASSWYFFDHGYLEKLLAIPGLELMLCRNGGEVAAGAVISHIGDIAQYHLGGTRDDWLKPAPMKIVFDEARRWAVSKGCTMLHLGGGLGSREDALFHFKAGFSDDHHNFVTWRWIVDPLRYQVLDEERSLHSPARADARARSEAHFPIYRS